MLGKIGLQLFTFGLFTTIVIYHFFTSYWILSWVPIVCWTLLGSGFFLWFICSIEVIVKLILKRSCNLYFDIIYAERKLNLVLKQIKLHIKNGVLNEQQVKSFTQLGFVSSANNTKLILQFNGEKSIMHAECKLVLSKLVFEVFRFTSFKNDSYISFTEKKGR